jgi:hypothetical protein
MILKFKTKKGYNGTMVFPNDIIEYRLKELKKEGAIDIYDPETGEKYD